MGLPTMPKQFWVWSLLPWLMVMDFSSCPINQSLLGEILHICQICCIEIRFSPTSSTVRFSRTEIFSRGWWNHQKCWFHHHGLFDYLKCNDKPKGLLLGHRLSFKACPLGWSSWDPRFRFAKMGVPFWQRWILAFYHIRSKDSVVFLLIHKWKSMKFSLRLL